MLGGEEWPRLDGRQVCGGEGIPRRFLVELGLVTFCLYPKRFVKQGKALHDASIIRARRGKAMRHLEELGIGRFDPIDGVMREALAADLVDPSYDKTAGFGGNARQRADRLRFKRRERLRRQETIEHAECGD